MVNNQYEYSFNKRYRKTRESLNRIADNIKRSTGLDVYDIQETDNGYIFKGKYGVVLGDLTYVPEEGGYRPFNYRQGAKDEIRFKEVEERRHPSQQRKRSKKFKLQRTRIGVAFAAGAIAALVAGGSIVLKTSAVEVQKPIYSVEQVNTVASANDLILNAWANYAIGEVTQSAMESQNTSVQAVANELKTNYYNNVMLQYYNYIDQIESGLPGDIIGKLTDSYHSSFRNQCYIMDEALESSYFSYATFDESPYADAIVFDQSGDEVVANGLYGESYDSSGNLIIAGGDVRYSVYVKAVDVPGNNYSITNLPADTKFINGTTYVSDEHLDDFVNTNNKVK